MEIREQVRAAITELTCADKKFNPVKLLAIGCSSSEIAGGTIGHASTYELGEQVAAEILAIAAEQGFECAFQCCEHLNRALVMEREAAEKYDYTEVCAVPHPKAGGSCASAAYRLMKDPVLVENVSADAGLDIGNTLIGMHLKAVAVPVRLSMNKIGEAPLTAAITRPKLIGGERAKYTL
jgi:uncharacterized protein (TIGR01440 family)